MDQVVNHSNQLFMKTLLFSFVTILAGAACNTDSSAVKEFVTGTYATSFHDSISPTANVEGVDTLVISKQTESGSDAYRILRRTRYQSMLDSVKQAEKTETQTWTGFFDKEHNIIKTETEKILAFDPANQSLVIGDKKYKKVR